MKPHIISHREPGPLRRFDNPELSELARRAIPDVEAALSRTWTCARCMKAREEGFVCPGQDECPDAPRSVRLYDMATPPPHNFQYRIKPELKAALKEEAKANRRTDTATLEIILEEALKHRLPALPSTPHPEEP